MNTITDLFQQAQLAEAAYANFIDPQTGLAYTDTTKITGALQDTGNNMGFSPVGRISEAIRRMGRQAKQSAVWEVDQSATWKLRRMEFEINFTMLGGMPSGGLRLRLTCLTPGLEA